MPSSRATLGLTLRIRWPELGSRSRTRTIVTRPLRKFRTRAVVPSGSASLATLSEFVSKRPPSAIRRPARCGAKTDAWPRLASPEGSGEAAGCADAAGTRRKEARTARNARRAIGSLGGRATHNVLQSAQFWSSWAPGCSAPFGSASPVRVAGRSSEWCGGSGEPLGLARAREYSHPVPTAAPVFLRTSCLC
jgi:hypothetical protein